MNTLILDHIHKSFARIDAQDVTQALSGINFTVQCGEFLYIVEPSSCGKSTIMRLIAGLIFSTAGIITINGDEILRLWQRSNHIVLMVTHDIDEALYFGTRIIVMAPRLAESGRTWLKICLILETGQVMNFLAGEKRF